MDKNLRARLRLIRTPGIGPVTYRQLLARFGTAEAAIEAVPELARRGGGNGPAIVSAAVVSREIEQVEKLGARYLFAGKGLYPALLDAAESAPCVLIVKGDLNIYPEDHEENDRIECRKCLREFLLATTIEADFV